jgi:hypothetical protein
MWTFIKVAILAAFLLTMPPWFIVNHINHGGHTVIYKTLQL